MAKPSTSAKRILIGWNEWCALPDLNIPAIKAKIDTGAKTSAIHALDITPFSRRGDLHVRFVIDPLQGEPNILIPCTALVIDQRRIMSSNGHHENRYVIETSLVIADMIWRIQVTLSNRDPLQYKLLLGREALARRVLIAPHTSCAQGKRTKVQLRKLYR